MSWTHITGWLFLKEDYGADDRAAATISSWLKDLFGLLLYYILSLFICHNLCINNIFAQVTALAGLL